MSTDENTNTTTPDYGDGSIDDVAAALLVSDEPVAEPEPEPKLEKPADAAPLPSEEPGEYDDATTDDETADAGDEQKTEEPQEPLHTVKVDGQEAQVTLEELKRAYSGQGYIQQRMQEVAATRKEAEQVYAALIEERAQVASVLQQYAQQSQLQGQPTPPDRALLQTDPIGYLEQEVAYREATERHQRLQQQAAMLSEQQAAQAQIQQQAYLREQTQLLVQRIPDLADANKAGAVKKALAETGLAYGYSQTELQHLSDARAAHVLYDAMRWRQLEAARSGIAQKVQDAGPVVKPGARQANGESGKSAQQKVRTRMQQSGSIDDVAAYLLT